ncbi:hypothetical protein BV25DRAFT_157236 [Artomyces pyxidatus]|uniref:Uncharacterized protein n=1 Tax=Artomyces pyxidatus TaxID=48021 RepID=A0ACB8TAX9_9AGAM|nr:hypothetical protein BV25DRAFT_157236 [Artomyces pyxidatus]
MHTSQMSSRSFPKATRKESLNFLNTTVKTADNPRREVDVHLPHNMTTTQCSSHASLPSTTPPTPKTTETTFASSSVTQLDPPPVHASSLNLPAPPSPTMSNKSSLFSDRAQTPSPITFAPVPLPARRPPEMTETSYLPSFPDPGALVFPAPAPGPDGSTSAGPASPTSPSRVRASLDEADVRRGFHLPMPRSLDAPLRPSFELSTEYAKARLQQDMSDPPTASSSSGSGYPPLTRIQSHSQSLKDEDDITVETVGFKDRPLDKLREEEEEEEVDGDRRSVLKEGLEFNEQQDHDVVTMRPIPRARQFYRKYLQCIHGSHCLVV